MIDPCLEPVTARPGPGRRLSPHQHFGFGGKGPFFQLRHYRFSHTSPRATSLHYGMKLLKQ